MKTNEENKKADFSLATFIENKTIHNTYGKRIRAEHAALVAVVEAADKVIKADNVLLEAQRNGNSTAINDALLDQYAALANLAAVRAGQPVAAVKYEEAVFNTKEDAEFWVAQERRKPGFHVIETSNAGKRVVFERRNGGAK